MSTSSSLPHSTEEPSSRRPVRLALALDVDDPDEALRLWQAVAGPFEVAKVGLELFSVAGPFIVSSLLDLGALVFVDLKLHDIPTTVERAARSLGRLGVSYTTLHTAGGEVMARAGAEGLAEGAAAAGFPTPVALGVTVLTSETVAPAELLATRVEVALSAGLGGVVCAASDLNVVRGLGPDLVTVVPGIRPAEASLDDQGRPATPAAAVRAGADVLVIGRPVTRAADPAGAAAAIASEISFLD